MLTYSQILDVDNMQVLAGPKGLKPGDELTVSPGSPPHSSPGHSCSPRPQFFYPSTEWEMAQPFDCSCGTPSCQGRVGGAKDMAPSQLEGYWLSGHIRQLKRYQQQEQQPEQEQDAEDAQSPTSDKTETPATGASSPSMPTPTSDDEYSADPPVLRANRGSISLDAKDPTVQALEEALDYAEKVVVAARTALDSYMDVSKTAAAAVAAAAAGHEDDGKGERVKHRGTFGENGGPLRRSPVEDEQGDE